MTDAAKIDPLDAINNDQVYAAAPEGTLWGLPDYVRALIASGVLVTAARARKRERAAITCYRETFFATPRGWETWLDREYPSLAPKPPKAPSPIRTITMSNNGTFRRVAGEWQWQYSRTEWRMAHAGPSILTLADAESVAALLREEAGNA